MSSLDLERKIACSVVTLLFGFGCSSNRAIWGRGSGVVETVTKITTLREKANEHIETYRETRDIESLLKVVDLQRQTTRILPGSCPSCFRELGLALSMAGWHYYYESLEALSSAETARTPTEGDKHRARAEENRLAMRRLLWESNSAYAILLRDSPMLRRREDFERVIGNHVLLKGHEGTRAFRGDWEPYRRQLGRGDGVEGDVDSVEGETAFLFSNRARDGRKNGDIFAIYLMTSTRRESSLREAWLRLQPIAVELVALGAMGFGQIVLQVSAVVWIRSGVTSSPSLPEQFCRRLWGVGVQDSIQLLPFYVLCSSLASLASAVSQRTRSSDQVSRGLMLLTIIVSGTQLVISLPAGLYLWRGELSWIF